MRMKYVMQQKTKSILSTRPLEASLMEKAVEKGISIAVISFIETTPANNDSLKNAVEYWMQQPATVVFTSMNAVESVNRYTGNQQPNWDIYSIGNTTRKLAEDFFGAPQVYGTADSAVALADEIIKNKNEKPVVFFCGDQRRDELPGKLNEAGIPLTEVITYHTIQTATKVSMQYDGILFFSPSAVHSFFSANSIHPETVLFAIGNTTAEALSQYSKNQIITGDKPGKENLLEKAIEFFSEL